MVLFNDRNVVKSVLNEREKSYTPITEDLCNKNCPDEFELIFEKNEDLLNLQIAKKMWDDIPTDERSSFSTLYLQYCPYSLEEDPKTLKIIADIINDLNFSTVTIADPHTPLVPALLKRCNVWYPVKDFLERYEDQYPGGRWDLLFYMSREDAVKYTKIIGNRYCFRYAARRLDPTNMYYTDYDIIAEKDHICGEEILLITDSLPYGSLPISIVVDKLHAMGACAIDLYITHIRPQDKQFIKECVEGKHNVRTVFTYDHLQTLNKDKICETVTIA